MSFGVALSEQEMQEFRDRVDIKEIDMTELDIVESTCSQIDIKYDQIGIKYS